MLSMKEFYDKLQSKAKPYLEMVAPYLNVCKNTCGIYLLWILLHFISAHMYILFCTPNKITGFIMSPFMAAAPHCQALRWGLYNGGNSIVSMWLTVGVCIMSYFPVFTTTEKKDKNEKDE
jgi:hypothetical protein